MSEVPQMHCMLCRRPFIWKKHKKYCSDKCANAAAAARAATRSLVMMNLPIASITKEMLKKLHGMEDPPDPLYLLLKEHAPVGATSYRVGCTQPGGGGKHPCMRWFPSSVSKRFPIYTLDPFETPSVPVPWDYVVAYFDAQNRVIGEPVMRVNIQYFNPQLNWSSGDRNLKVESPDHDNFW